MYGVGYASGASHGRWQHDGDLDEGLGFWRLGRHDIDGCLRLAFRLVDVQEETYEGNEVSAGAREVFMVDRESQVRAAARP